MQQLTTLQSHRLDLFKLHDDKIDDNPKKWIVVKGHYLKTKLRILIEALAKDKHSKTVLVKYFMKRFNISITTSERLIYLKKEWMPLIFIKELIILNANQYDYLEIQSEIEFIKVNQPPLKVLKAPKCLSLNLCKIAGAHAADGTIHDNYFAISDGYESNLIAFKRWLFEEFGLESEIKKISDNEWRINFHNKIITRYLTKILSFPNGSKQYFVKEPLIIKNTSSHHRRAFALGALTFEAGIGIKNQVELCVSSKQFRDDLSEILSDWAINHVSMKNRSGNYWRLWSFPLHTIEDLNWLDFFEECTEKHDKIKNALFGFSRQVSSYGEACQILSKYHTKKSASKIGVLDVLDIIKNKEKTCRYEIVNELKKKNASFSGGRWAHSIKHYLDILKRANIIFIKKEYFGKKKSFGSITRQVYLFNPHTASWKMPN